MGKTRSPLSFRTRIDLAKWIRLAISLALIAWIIQRVDWAEFGRTVRVTDPVYLVLSLTITPVLVLISAWKWKILLSARSSDPGIATCFRLYLVGYFFNHFLPTNVGGDVVRAYILGRRIGRQADAIASVFLERFTGITVLVAFALIAIPFAPAQLLTATVRWGIGAVVVAYLVLLWAIVDRRILRFSRNRTHLPFVGKIVEFQEAISLYRAHRAALAACIALSGLFYLVAALDIIISARAFRADLGILDVLVVTPVVLIISSLPLSIGGWGLMEWAYLFGLGKYGIPPAVGLSTALLIRVKGILLGLVGGFEYSLAEGAPHAVSESPPAGTESVRK